MTTTEKRPVSWWKVLRSLPFTVAMIWFIWTDHDLRWALTALFIIVAMLDANLVATRDWIEAATERLGLWGLPWITRVPKKGHGAARPQGDLEVRP